VRIEDFHEYLRLFRIPYPLFSDLKRKGPMPKLFIGNLPHSSSDAELQLWVEARGFRVESVQVMHNRVTGKSRGFGFVTLSNDVDVQSAISVLNGRRMNGRILTVNEALPLTADSYAGHGGPEPRQNPPVPEWKR